MGVYTTIILPTNDRACVTTSFKMLAIVFNLNSSVESTAEFRFKHRKDYRLPYPQTSILIICYF